MSNEAQAVTPINEINVDRSRTFWIAIDRESGRPCSVFEGQPPLYPWAQRYRFISWDRVARALDLLTAKDGE